MPYGGNNLHCFCPREPKTIGYAPVALRNKRESAEVSVRDTRMPLSQMTWPQLFSFPLQLTCNPLTDDVYL